MVTSREWRVLPNIYSMCRELYENPAKGSTDDGTWGLDSHDTNQISASEIHRMGGAMLGHDAVVRLGGTAITVVAEDKTATSLEEMRDELQRLSDELQVYQKQVEATMPAAPVQNNGMIVLPPGAKLVTQDSHGAVYEVHTINGTVKYKTNIRDSPVTGVIDEQSITDNWSTHSQIVDEATRQALVREKLQELERVREEAGKIQLACKREILCQFCQKKLCEKCYHCHACELSETEKQLLSH